MTMPRRRYHPAAYIAIYTLLAAGPEHARAQDPAGTNPLLTIPEHVRQKRMVHVSPHLIVFNPSTRSATVEFSNIGDTPTEAEVAVQLGFTYWQNEDTALLPPPGESQRGRDTVIVDPGPADRYAGRWISGLPTYIRLNPHEKRRVTLRIGPPSNLPNGEYYARIVTMVGARKKRAPVSQDTKERYMFPIKAWDLPLIRDSARVFYRQGRQTMGIRLLDARAELDTSSTAPIEEVGPHPLRILLRLHLTGTAHFEGKIQMSYLTRNGDENLLAASEGAAFALHRDGIMRWTAETDLLPPGRYHLLLKLLPEQAEFPPDERLPAEPVEIELPFEIPPK